MASQRARSGYSTVQIALHWAVAGLVTLQLAVNAGVRQAFRDGTGLEQAGAGAVFHVVTGLAVLALMLARLGLRLHHGPSAAAANVHPLVHRMAGLAHAALYATLILMPLTGALAWFGASQTAATAHEIGRLILVALIGGHVIGALFEHFVLGNALLWRMLRPLDPAQPGGFSPAPSHPRSGATHGAEATGQSPPEPSP